MTTSALTWLGATLAALPVGVAALSLAGRGRWARASAALRQRLLSNRTEAWPLRFDARELDALPAPVQRYFRAVLRDGVPIATAAELVHRGEFNLGQTGDRWTRFTSRQRVVTRPPGFVWDASIAVLPGLPVRVHDAYIGGEGLLRAQWLGLLTLADERGGGELARGELMRYVAEAAWYPTALLPSQGARWDAVGASAARVTLADGPLQASLTCRFNDDGTMRSCHADARGRMVGGQMLPTPWQGRWSDHQWRDGMCVPIAGEVAWCLPEGPRPYWRGRIESLRFEHAA